MLKIYLLIFQLREEDDVSDWDEGDATDEALEMPRRVPFPEFGGDIVHNTGKKSILPIICARKRKNSLHQKVPKV